MGHTDRLEDPRAEAAIQWMVEMRSGDVSERQLRAFEAWLDADPDNETTWIRLQEGLMPCGVAARQQLARGALTRQLIERRHGRRAFLTGLVGCVAGGALAGGALDRFLPLGSILADHVTLTGQQRTVQLPDGSSLTLAARSAVDVQYETGIRRIRLVTGEMLVRAAARSTPFQADAGPMALQTQGGAFLLEHRDDAISATACEGSGTFGPSADPSRTSRNPVLAAGHQIVFASGQMHQRRADVQAAMAWLNGLLVANDSTVASVAARLQSYFPGIIRVDPDVADVRVTGVFSLKEPDAALDALAASLDLSVTRIARYWVRIGAAST